MCCYFNGIIKFEDFELEDVLIDKKSYENIDWSKTIVDKVW